MLQIQECEGSGEADDEPPSLAAHNPIDHIFQFHKALKRELHQIEVEAKQLQVLSLFPLCPASLRWSVVSNCSCVESLQGVEAWPGQLISCSYIAFNQVMLLLEARHAAHGLLHCRYCARTPPLRTLRSSSPCSAWRVAFCLCAASTMPIR